MTSWEAKGIPAKDSACRTASKNFETQKGKKNTRRIKSSLGADGLISVAGSELAVQDLVRVENIHVHAIFDAFSVAAGLGQSIQDIAIGDKDFSRIGFRFIQ